VPGDPTATIPPEGFIKIGVLGRAFQLDGGVRLHPVPAAGPLALDRAERVFVMGFGPASIRQVRMHGDAILLYLQGVRDRDDAQRLTGAEVFAPSSVLPADTDDVSSLTGAEVVQLGHAVGHVREVRHDAVNPLLVILTAGGDVLVPLNAPYVVVQAGRVELVDPPEGLLDPT
jgi:16S rRNA processing protein RimM